MEKICEKSHTPSGDKIMIEGNGRKTYKEGFLLEIKDNKALTINKQKHLKKKIFNALEPHRDTLLCSCNIGL